MTNICYGGINLVDLASLERYIRNGFVYICTYQLLTFFIFPFPSCCVPSLVYCETRKKVLDKGWTLERSYKHHQVLVNSQVIVNILHMKLYGHTIYIHQMFSWRVSTFINGINEWWAWLNWTPMKNKSSKI